MISDIAYFSRRAADSRRAVVRACDPCARIVHRRLAAAYDRLVRASRRDATPAAATTDAPGDTAG